VLWLKGAEQSDREWQFEASDYISKGKVKVMTETFPLDDIADVYERVNNENVRFGAVVTMNYLKRRTIMHLYNARCQGML
jgi:D-arabinose 1-dehydrogenase-like Zn-dependent alcohol dehydrogenase